MAVSRRLGEASTFVARTWRAIRSWCPRRPCARAGTQSRCSRWTAAAGWRCWLAAELARRARRAAGSASTPVRARRRTSAQRAAAGRGRGVRRVPERRPAPSRREHRRGALPELRRAGVDLHLVPERAHGLRLDLQGRAGDPRRAHAANGHGAGRAQPPAEHLPRAGPAGYEVFKVESASAVCPPAICPGARTRRPGRANRLAGGGRPARFHKWIGAIRQRARPAFYFHHALLPHEPWIYLPSGRQSRPAGEDPILDINHDVGFGDPDLTVAQPPAPSAPGGLHGPPGRAAARAAAAHRSARARAARGDGRPRLLVRRGREEQAPDQRATTSRRSRRSRCSSRRPGRPRARSTRAWHATSTSSRRSPTCSARASGTGRTGARSSRERSGRAARSRCGRATSRHVVRIGPRGARRRRASAAALARGSSAPARRASSLYGDPWARAYASARTASCSAGAWRRCA